MNFSFSVAKPKPFRREAFWRLKGLGTDKVSNRFSLGKKKTLGWMDIFFVVLNDEGFFFATDEVSLKKKLPEINISPANGWLEY